VRRGKEGTGLSKRSGAREGIAWNVWGYGGYNTGRLIQSDGHHSNRRRFQEYRENGQRTVRLGVTDFFRVDEAMQR
jgi:hypothetical protein